MLKEQVVCYLKLKQNITFIPVIFQYLTSNFYGGSFLPHKKKKIIHLFKIN